MYIKKFTNSKFFSSENRLIFVQSDHMQKHCELLPPPPLPEGPLRVVQWNPSLYRPYAKQNIGTLVGRQLVGRVFHPARKLPIRFSLLKFPLIPNSSWGSVSYRPSASPSL